MTDIDKPPTSIPDGLSGPRLQAWLEGYMLFPDDGQLAMSWYARRVLMANKEITWSQRGEIPVPAVFLRALLDGPSGNELESLEHKGEKDGNTAGIILSLVRAMDSGGYREPSVNKAIFLIAETSSFSTQQDRHVSVPACRAAWKRMRPVAHLWAAGVVAPMKWKRGGLDVLLSLAEMFREFGCSFVPARTHSRATLLDPAVVLQTGREPTTSHSIRLPGDLLEILRQYKFLGTPD